MKVTIIFFSVFLIMSAESLMAQGKSRIDTVNIITSADCHLCQHKIEETLTFERGVRSAKLDLDSKIVTVVYLNRRTNPDKIREAIIGVGYDADFVKKGYPAGLRQD